MTAREMILAWAASPGFAAIHDGNATNEAIADDLLKFLDDQGYIVRQRKIKLRFEWDDNRCSLAALKVGVVFRSVDQWCGNPVMRRFVRFPTETEARAYVERVFTEAIEQAMVLDAYSAALRAPSVEAVRENALREAAQVCHDYASPEGDELSLAILALIPLADRDDTIAALRAQLASRDATIAKLEARLAEAKKALREAAEVCLCSHRRASLSARATASKKEER